MPNGLNDYEYIDRAFCIECGMYFQMKADDESFVELSCGCQRKRLYTRRDWEFLEGIGHGIGMSLMIFRLFDVSTGEGTTQQRIDAFVREKFGDWAECDKGRAMEVFRVLRNGE